MEVGEEDKNIRLLHCCNCETYPSSDETKWVKYDAKGVKSKGQMLRDQRDLLLLTGKEINSTSNYSNNYIFLIKGEVILGVKF